MKTQNNFTKLFTEFKKRDSYWAQKAIIDFSVELYKLMKLRKLSKKDFAEKLGTSQAYVTKVFKGDANFTIETMVRLTRALGGQMKIHVSPAEMGNINWWQVLKGNKPPKQHYPKAWTHNMATETVGALDLAEGELG